ncbi:MAG: class I SAM-dependent methyltransferase, partial [Pirellulales bacterium]|nr:class I SAM-dependent methyltransferase [Pirellulales bacterium]
NSDAENLPMPEHTFDAYTSAFCLRNVTNIESALSEAHRILKPGGHFLCLEFSHVVLPIIRKMYDTYSFNVLPWLGKMVVNDRQHHFCSQVLPFVCRQQYRAALGRVVDHVHDQPHIPIYKILPGSRFLGEAAF